MNRLLLRERIVNNILFTTLQHPVTNITLLLINTVLVFISVYIAYGALSVTQVSVESTNDQFKANRTASDSLLRTQMIYSRLLNDTLVSQVVQQQQISQSQLKNSLLLRNSLISQIEQLQQVNQSQLKNTLLLHDDLVSQVEKLQQVNLSQLKYSQLLKDSLIHQIAQIQQITRTQLELSNKQLIILDNFPKEQLGKKTK
ncbi:MAG: hypothetical protein HYV28_10310 [Ignavibacteriales bacterium]|nr:hypothetical protein [Ignavibacteriales bacterium]